MMDFLFCLPDPVLYLLILFCSLVVFPLLFLFVCGIPFMIYEKLKEWYREKTGKPRFKNTEEIIRHYGDPW